MCGQRGMPHLGGQHGGDIGQNAVGQVGARVQHRRDEHIARSAANGVQMQVQPHQCASGQG